MGFSTVGVIGLGYIGLPTAAILADGGLSVTGVDINPDTVEAVNRGEVPFVEPDLAGYVDRVVSAGKLRAVAAPERADAFIVAVPTPFRGDHEPDLTYIEAAARALAPQLSGGELVILESTSPPGATRRMAEWILEVRADLSLDGADGRPAIHVAHCPERVLPGKIMTELVTNDRIVGGLTREAAERARDLYQTFCEGEILLTDAVTAELAKLVENSFRDVNIAFANELSIVADRLGVDVWELIRLANHHPRVNILQPGPGVGGHCIAVDPWFVIDAAPGDTRLIRAAREVNDGKPRWVLHKVLDAVAGVETPVIAAWGLAFKANIDDLRESPAVEIVAETAATFPQATVLVVEPHVDALPEELQNLANVRLVSAEEALDSGDVQVLLVDHAAFRGMLGRLGGRRLVDTRGMTSGRAA
ncbi:UDP-N-acetyl-D-mannosamine dehydrogenase [Myceligenerans pegani]|uniref:UDP-N-acetyl-D-mannosamine dehydrogenase n=1 Tax=Myceligenerans pegani TaxID=2776917 RepID=A0ABR9N1U5_9MICO|nr:UDP-N-acetyl-D-mannosamine dehydrogenase [Myceligenerans sp. TRM 65318]MBE1877119.1 UDP-N-acetyl-D-mannosamine dehydrogenase [Myceligenerans sp. TRM 65318]MBE3019390.1 UDP-N-acetyl-D-mannosamine dehydrogenase [Myceligenerans sp. TRM 65318]